MRKQLTVPIVAAMMALLDASPAIAQEVGAADDTAFDNRITGDWNGRRAMLLEKGIDLSVGYINEPLHNTTGGTRSTGAYADQLMFGADVDFEKLWGWRGGSFHVLLTNRNGLQLDTEAGLGTLLEVHEIFGRGHHTRLTRFYAQQDLFNHRLTVKLGRGDVDFFPFSCEFINISFCGPLPAHHSKGWYSWPISQYFGNVTLRPGNGLYVKLGASDVNPRNLDPGQGVRLTTPAHNGRGTLSNVEGGWLPGSGSGSGRAFAGAYRFGYWRDSSAYPDLLLNQQGQPLPIAGGTSRMHDTSTGYYAMAQQQLTRNDAGGGVVAFANLSHSDTDVSRVDRLLSVGVWWTGVLRARPLDRLSIALGRSRVSASFRAFEQLNPADIDPGIRIGNGNGNGIGSAAPERGSEQPFEVNYSIAVTRGLSLMPSVQYVRDPGGRSDAKRPLILGLKLSAEF